MKRLLLVATIATMMFSPLVSDARIWRSNCSGGFHAGDPGDCTVILAGPVTGTATAQPDEDGNARVHLVLTADPRDVYGNPIMEPIVLAECSAEAVGEAATCSIEWYGELSNLPTFGGSNSQGNSLPGRCTGEGFGDGVFSCVGGTV